MIELIMVIIVIGILAALAIPRIERDYRQEAADNILSAIRHTQHLALMDNKHMDGNPMWQQRFWRIVFSQCSSTGHFYMVGSDNDMESSNNANFDQDEADIDPITNKPLFYKCSGMAKKDASPSIFIGEKYGVKTVASSGGCAGSGGKHIAFDHLGRPHYGTAFSQSITPDYSSYMPIACTFTFTMEKGDPFTIQIVPETGYAQIINQDGS